jgi:hypothetical protein
MFQGKIHPQLWPAPNIPTVFLYRMPVQGHVTLRWYVYLHGQYIYILYRYANLNSYIYIYTYELKHVHIYNYIYILGFPKMGVPPDHLLKKMAFPYKPSNP